LDPEYYSPYVKYLEHTDDKDTKLWKVDDNNPLLDLSKKMLYNRYYDHLESVADFDLGNYSGVVNNRNSEIKNVESPAVFDIFSKIRFNECKRQARADFVYKKMSEILCSKMKEIHDEIISKYPADAVRYENLLDYCLIMSSRDMRRASKKKIHNRRVNRWRFQVPNYFIGKGITIVGLYISSTIDLYPKIVRDSKLINTLYNNVFIKETYYIYTHTILRDYFFIFLANAALEYNLTSQHNGMSFLKYASTVKIPIISVMDQIQYSSRYISLFREKMFICRKIASFDSLYEQVRLVEKMQEAGFGDRIKQWKAEITQELESAEHNEDNIVIRRLYPFEHITINNESIESDDDSDG
jgi:hypothetical protein